MFLSLKRGYGFSVGFGRGVGNKRLYAYIVFNGFVIGVQTKWPFFSCWRNYWLKAKERLG